MSEKFELDEFDDEMEGMVGWRGWCGGEPLMVPVEHEWVAGEEFGFGMLRAAGQEGGGYWILRWDAGRSQYWGLYVHEDTDEAAMVHFRDAVENWEGEQ